jgi:hypothetical protein
MEVKKRVMKKARLEFKAGPSQVREEVDDGIEDNSESTAAVLWVVVDALHDIQDSN